jgi:hypothetical protein
VQFDADSCECQLPLRLEFVWLFVGTLLIFVSFASKLEVAYRLSPCRAPENFEAMISCNNLNGIVPVLNYLCAAQSMSQGLMACKPVYITRQDFLMTRRTSVVLV